MCEGGHCGCMGRGRIVDALKKGKTLVSDGAWGTFLQKKGLKPGECPELWCIDRPADVLDVAKAYVDAGADMIESDSFGGTSYKLEHYGQAAGDHKWVIASVGPTGKMLALGDITEQDLYNSFKDQVMALEAGGADAVCIETMSAIDEAEQAIKAARENTGLEVICTFTFEKTAKGDYRTMMGVTPTDAAKAAVKAGAHVIGANCGNGIERMVEIVKEMRKAATKTPILVHANAGLPQNIDGKDVFPDTPEKMGKMVKDLVKAGANIVGGCCGTTPAHIAAMKKALS
jgi:5-methyltetrahydrofolate--homocysteine methyltransferase